MSRLKINTITGAYSVLPDPKLETEEIIVTATAEDLVAMATPGIKKWLPDDPSLPLGSGKIVVTGPVTPRTPATPAAPTSIDKLLLKRRLEAIGQWDAFKAAMAQMPESVQEDFNLASVLNLSDPTFTTYAPQLKALMELTDEEYTALFTPN